MRTLFLLFSTLACQIPEVADNSQVLANVDADGDGVSANLDCNDADPQIHPGAAEYCDGVDNNCNGEIDEPSANAGRFWYWDKDDDGYGRAADYDNDGVDDDLDQNGVADNILISCVQPMGYVGNDGDCNDELATVNPSAPESCNGIDDDCNGLSDEASAVDAETWFIDVDGDGYGDVSEPLWSCDQPAGAVANALDCDDASADIHPGADENCNAVDDDCDGTVDEPDSTDAVLQYLDADGDGFGAGFPLLSCDTLDNHVLVEGDCNDGMATVNPAATEVCNGIDDDCSGTVDVGAVDPVTYHLDADSDGHGDPTISVESCPDFDPVTQLPGIPIGLSLLSDDCNDADASVSPSANELCTTTLDENCDGDPVYNAVDPSLYVLDFDQDGYGTFDNSFQACQAYFPYLLWTTDSLEDCDDFDPLVLPGQDPDFELCNGKLDRCEQDDGNLTPPPEELDDDGDGFVDCSLDVDPSVWGNGTILGGDDCDDQDSGVYPLAMERCNGIFDDCISRVGVVTAPEDELDDDGDGQVECPYFDSATWLGDSSVSSGADCDDTDPEIYTGAASSHPSICASDLNLDGYPDCRYGSVCDHVLGTGTGQIDFAQIPAGGFQMGSDVLQEGHENDETNHPVTISFDFAMMTTEVTQRAYESVVDSDWTQYGTAFGLGDDQPVYNVSWSMAANFANGLTALHNQQYGTNFRNCYLCSGSGSTILCQEDYDLMFCDGYRLPTEAEWEYATKSGVSNDFWTAAGGADLAPATGADCDAGLVLDDSSVLANFAWFCGTNASDDVQEVGLLDENARGLFDLHGNVWEWTHDAYQYDLGVDPQTDPVFSQGPYRSIRGGAWFSQPTGLRAANRSYALPQMHYHYVGFRLVRRLF